MVFTELQLEAMKNEFIALLKSTNRPGVDKLLAAFEKNDFYYAPASTQYHSAIKGGLLYHSLCTYRAMKQLADSFKALVPMNQKLQSVTEQSIIIVSLLHDLHKVNFYKQVVKAWKDDSVMVGQSPWKHYYGYQVESKFHVCNRSKALIYITSCIEPTMSEYTALDGVYGFEEGRNDTAVGELYQAMDTEPLLVLLQMATKGATYLMEELTDIKRENAMD